MLTLAILAASVLPAFAATATHRFVHPQGDYALEYPSSWKRSVGMEMLKLRPSGAAGKLVRISIEKHPLGAKDPATPSAFIADLLKNAQGLRRLDARDTVRVSGKDAERLTLTETMELKDESDRKLPGPLTEVVIVVAFQKGCYVLRLSGMGADLASVRPTFNRLVSSFTLGPLAR